VANGPNIFQMLLVEEFILCACMCVKVLK